MELLKVKVLVLQRSDCDTLAGEVFIEMGGDCFGRLLPTALPSTSVTWPPETRAHVMKVTVRRTKSGIRENNCFYKISVWSLECTAREQWRQTKFTGELENELQ